MTGTDTIVGETGFKDRSVGLIVFGILEIMMGLVCALMVPLTLASLLVPSSMAGGTPAPDVRMMVPALMMYVVLAVAFIWLGVGSILARRWARALLLVTSSIWLAIGVMALLFFVLSFGDIFSAMSAAGDIPEAAAAIIKYITLVALTVMYIVVPGGLVLFYRSEHVKATCERRDLKVRWTDRCPLPVLGISLMAGAWAAWMPVTGIYGWLLPFFGTFVSGPAGAVVALVSMGLVGYVAWGTYKLDSRAWWCAVFVIAAWGLSSALTFTQGGLMDMYERMDLSEQQMELLRQNPGLAGQAMVPFFVLWVVVALGYLLYTRKFFVAGGTAGAARADTPGPR